MDQEVYRRPRGATIDPSNGQGTSSKGLRLGQRRGTLAQMETPLRFRTPAPDRAAGPVEAELTRVRYRLRPRAEGATFRYDRGRANR